MSKLREALKEARTLLEKIHSAYSDSQGDVSIYQLRKVIKVVDEALAKPLRNCDVFEGHRVEDEFEKAMKFTPSQTADERDELMRENWFLFRLWLFAEAKGDGK